MPNIHPLADVKSMKIGKGTKIWQYSVIFENAPLMTIALSLMKNGHRSDVEFVLPHHEV